MGVGKVTVGKKTWRIKGGDEVFIKKGQLHRAEGVKTLKLLEITFGDFDSGDIVRVEDDYGRT